MFVSVCRFVRSAKGETLSVEDFVALSPETLQLLEGTTRWWLWMRPATRPAYDGHWAEIRCRNEVASTQKDSLDRSPLIWEIARRRRWSGLQWSQMLEGWLKHDIPLILAQYELDAQLQAELVRRLTPTQIQSKSDTVDIFLGVKSRSHAKYTAGVKHRGPTRLTLSFGVACFLTKLMT